MQCAAVLNPFSLDLMETRRGQATPGSDADSPLSSPRLTPVWPQGQLVSLETLADEMSEVKSMVRHVVNMLSVLIPHIQSGVTFQAQERIQDTLGRSSSIFSGDGENIENINQGPAITADAQQDQAQQSPRAAGFYDSEDGQTPRGSQDMWGIQERLQQKLLRANGLCPGSAGFGAPVRLNSWAAPCPESSEAVPRPKHHTTQFILRPSQVQLLRELPPEDIQPPKLRRQRHPVVPQAADRLPGVPDAALLEEAEALEEDGADRSHNATSRQSSACQPAGSCDAGASLPRHIQARSQTDPPARDLSLSSRPGVVAMKSDILHTGVRNSSPRNAPSGSGLTEQRNLIRDLSPSKRRSLFVNSLSQQHLAQDAGAALGLTLEELRERQNNQLSQMVSSLPRSSSQQRSESDSSQENIQSWQQGGSAAEDDNVRSIRAESAEDRNVQGPANRTQAAFERPQGSPSGAGLVLASVEPPRDVPLVTGATPDLGAARSKGKGKEERPSLVLVSVLPVNGDIQQDETPGTMLCRKMGLGGIVVRADMFAKATRKYLASTRRSLASRLAWTGSRMNSVLLHLVGLPTDAHQSASEDISLFIIFAVAGFIARIAMLAATLLSAYRAVMLFPSLEVENTNEGVLYGGAQVSQTKVSDAALALSALAILIVSRVCGRARGKREKTLVEYARTVEFLHSWDRKSAWEAWNTWLLLLCALLLRGWLCAESAPGYLTPILVDTAFFGVVAVALLTSLHSLVHTCCGLLSMVDNYCFNVAGRDVAIPIAVQHWNFVQAITRASSSSMQVHLAVLLCSLGAVLLAVVVDFYRTANSAYVFIPSLLLIASIARMLSLASSVTERCAAVHGFVNSLHRGEALDDERQYLVTYIKDSSAGWYIFERSLTGALAWRFFYLALVGPFFAESKFPRGK